MLPPLFLVLLLLLPFVSAVCVEQLAPSPFGDEAYFMGAMPIPGRQDVLMAFSNLGRITLIDAETGQLVSEVGQVGLSADGGEAGLLAVAVRPDFAQSGKFYTWGNTVQGRERDLALDEWSCAEHGDTISGCARTGVVLEVYHMFSNHNGGSLMFDARAGASSSSVLYLSVGDGGSACDPENTSRDHKRLLGKLLRIDVGRGSAANYNYTIPATNPIKATRQDVQSQLCGKALEVQRAKKTKQCREIWAKGLRNPYRCSVDAHDPGRKYGVWCGDVGQGNIEEVDLIPTTGSSSRGWQVPNYGWDVFEGSRGAKGQGCTGTGQRCPLGFATKKRVRGTNYVCPVAEETHQAGWGSLIGGYVCRQCGDKALEGRFLYVDYFLPNSLRAVTTPLANGRRSTPRKSRFNSVDLCRDSTKCQVQPEQAALGADNWMIFSFAMDNARRISLIHAQKGLYRIVDPKLCSAV